jgi:hypothetical protein
MTYLIVCTFTNCHGGNEFSYRAFSPQEVERTRANFRKDVFYQIGYQENTDKMTLHGYLEEIIESTCAAPDPHTENAIHCVVRSNRTIDTSYSFLRINDDYSTEITGHVLPIPHFYVQSNLNFDADDSESDSDSDSD